MNHALYLSFLFTALPSFVFALGTVTEPRYFDLSFPISEGVSTESHPWTLDFGHATPLHSNQEQSNGSTALRLEPTEPNAQLAYNCIEGPDSWIFVSTRVTLAPSKENAEFFDFCGALVSFRRSGEGGRLGFLSRAPKSGAWTWFELDQPVGQAIGDSGPTVLDLKFAIHRSTGRWALGVDDLAFPNLDLVPDPASGQPEDMLYILGLEEHPIIINDIRIAEIRESVLQDSLNDPRLRMLIPEDSEFFIEEGLTQFKHYTQEQSPERIRILYFRGFRFKVLDQDHKAMKRIDGGELGPIVVYGSAGPTPSFLEVIIDAEYTDPRDLKHIKWELYASDDIDHSYTPFSEGRFNQGSMEAIIPLRMGKNDPPLRLSLRVFLNM